MNKLTLLIIFALYLIYPSSAYAAELYVSPIGNDSHPGSVTQPWKTFAFAIPKLRPGDTLILFDGIYNKTTTGLPSIDCASANINNGTATAPIIIKAQNERQAFLQSDGSTSAFYIINCSYWDIIGLSGRSVDLASGNGGRQTDVFQIRYGDRINLKRLLFTHDNRYFNNQIYGILNSKNILIEESEAYFFHRHGFSIWKSHDITIRRSYANSRGYPTQSDHRYSGHPEGGDEAFVFYQTSNSIIENSISENKSLGFQIHGGETFDNQPGGHHNKFLGDISLNDAAGAHVDSRSNGSAEHNLFENFLVINANWNLGFYLRSAGDTTLKNVTVFGTANYDGITGDEKATSGILCSIISNGCSFTVINSLVWNNNRYGIYGTSANQWLVEYSNSFANGTANYNPSENISDSSGNIRNSLSVAPTEIGLTGNQTMVYIPDDSNMKGAGKNGADIGANILYRYQDGVLTDQPLWDPPTGTFPCGAIVPGLNDVVGESCFDVHQRLNVNPNTLPPDYGSKPPNLKQLLTVWLGQILSLDRNGDNKINSLDLIYIGY